MPQRNRIEFAVRLTNPKARRFARLDFVHNAVVHVLEGRGDDSGEAIAIFADDIHAGFQSGCLRGRQQRGGLGAELFVRRIESIEQQNIAQMKNSRFDSVEIQVASVPQGIGSAVVEKSAAAAVHFRHDIRIGSRRAAGGAQKSRIDPVFPAILQDALAQSVLADPAGAVKGKRRAQSGQIHQDVVRRAAGPLRLAADIGKLFALRIDID